LSLALLIYASSGCNLLNQSIMLRTDKSYVFDSIPDTLDAQYKISPNDLLDFRLFSKDGFKLIDITSMAQQGNFNFNRNIVQYLVEFDGMVKLPILGRIKLAGKALREAELYLQERYRDYYNDPFVLLNVTNRRVIVFPGDDGAATVINLINNNTTLMEAMAMAGGLSANGKAQKVKLIRNFPGQDSSTVYQIDLSTIEGLKYANMVVQANDIIYVEPRLRVASDFIREISPIISLITSTIVLVTFYRSITN
jgi:polysaccharide export outer membrane protein